MSDEQNPYAAPTAEVEPPRPPYGPPVPGKAPARRGVDWIVRGWGYFAASPLAWAGALSLLYVTNQLLIIVPVIGFVAAQVLSPIFTGGLMTGCLAVDRGGRFRFTHLFAGFSDPAASRLAGAGGLQFAMLVIVGLIFGGLWVGMRLATDTAADAAAITATTDGLLWPLLIVLPAVIPILMLILFAPVLIILHGMAVTDAMGLSYRACARNVLPILVWILCGILIAVLAALPFVAIGAAISSPYAAIVMLVVFAGVLGSIYMASVYAAYVDIFDKFARPAA